jgi:putative nucleotidyltransferase with HDIG domain
MPELVALTLDAVLADIERLPSLPAAVDALVAALGDENISIDELARGIAKDQVLAARALRVANSAFYGLRHKVSSIHEAIVVLGFSAVGSLVTAASVTGYFKPSADSGFDLKPFWRHCFGAALCARALARNLRQNASKLNPESAFTAGLLHDIGALLLATTRPAHYAEVLAACNQQDRKLHQVERRILGFDHAAVGAALAVRWRFPPEIVLAVARHHEPESAAGEIMVDVVHAANMLAYELAGCALADADERELLSCFHPAVGRRLGLDEKSLHGLLEGILPEHEAFSAMLEADG